MILVVDVGNTNIVIGVYEGRTLLNSWRMSTITNKTADETGIFMCSVLEKSGYSTTDVEDCIISSVVPNIMYSLVHGIQKYFRIDPLIVSVDLTTKIKLNLVENPKEVGADRIVNCEAAYHLYGGPVIIIDYGTATTYDVINEQGELATAITAPGVKISAEALYTKAALLGKVELVMPKSSIVHNTKESMQAGIILGRIGETEYIVNRLKKELDIPKAKVVSTGGLARIISQGTNIFDKINSNLTLEGLRIIYENNTQFVR